MKVGGRAATNIPKIPSQASNHRKNVIRDHQKMESPSSTVPKVAETGQPIEVLHAMRTGVGAEAGRGRATVLPPKPYP